MNGTIWDNREAYRLWDPLRHAKNFATPQFVVHNDLDYRLPVSEGIAMFNALQELGVPSRFLNFPDEGHWVDSWSQAVVTFNALLTLLLAGFEPGEQSLLAPGNL